MRFVFAAVCLVRSCLGGTADDQQFNGRWDITVNGLLRPHAWWLEVTGAATPHAKGRFVGAPGGRADDVPNLTISGGELRFSLDRRAPSDHKLMQRGLYFARLEDGRLQGTFEVEGDPGSYLDWVGVRAPILPEHDDNTWKRGDPVTLFNGRDLSGWSGLIPGRLGWVVRDGALENQPGAQDLISDRKFWNFDLHVEFLMQPNGNSGIALRGRYEVQLMDDFAKPVSKYGTGSIYSRLSPMMNASRPAGDWQTMEIRLIGRQVSVTLNGFRVIEKGIIEGITAMAFDANEGEPGPVVLQGDHGPVHFRKLILYPLIKAK